MQAQHRCGVETSATALYVRWQGLLVPTKMVALLQANDVGIR